MKPEEQHNLGVKFTQVSLYTGRFGLSIRMPPAGLLGPSLAWELVAVLQGSSPGTIRPQEDLSCTIHVDVVLGAFIFA